MFQVFWVNGQLPQDLRDANIIHLYKNKGDRSSCDNHRGISLLSIAGKILARIMLNRITKHILDDVVSESQCGFRKQRGTVDMVFAIRQLQEKCVEQHQDLHLLFIDLTKAFDTVNRAALWTILSKFGCPPWFVQIIRSFHDGMFCRVIENGDASDPFPVSNGVKRACANAVLLSCSQCCSPLRSDALCSTLPNWGRSQNSLPHWWRFLQPPPPEVLHQSDSGHCARLPLCRWLRTCGSLRGRPTRAGWLFRHCSKVIQANSEHKENWSVETARPKHSSAPTQHYHGWKCTEKCRHLQIPRQLHKLCSQPWWWGSVPHLTSKPGIWAPPHPSMARAGHLDQDQAEHIPSCCATVYPVRLRDLDLLQAAYQETGPVPSTCAAFTKFSMSAGRNMCQTRRSFAGLSSLALKPCWTRHSFAGQDMSLAWMTADSQNNCSMLSSQLVNGTKAGRGSGTKTCWNRPSRPATSQLTSGKPWPRTGRPGGQLHARAQSTLREADYRAWMIRGRQGRTECQTLALLYLVSSAARSALPLSGSKLICANTSTDASSSYSKDYYYYYSSFVILLFHLWKMWVLVSNEPVYWGPNKHWQELLDFNTNYC